MGPPKTVSDVRQPAFFNASRARNLRGVPGGRAVPGRSQGRGGSGVQIRLRQLSGRDRAYALVSEAWPGTAGPRRLCPPSPFCQDAGPTASVKSLDRPCKRTAAL